MAIEGSALRIGTNFNITCTYSSEHHTINIMMTIEMMSTTLNVQRVPDMGVRFTWVSTKKSLVSFQSTITGWLTVLFYENTVKPSR